MGSIRRLDEIHKALPELVGQMRIERYFSPDKNVVKHFPQRGCENLVAAVTLFHRRSSPPDFLTRAGARFPWDKQFFLVVAGSPFSI
jgi:hypothetical protein